jgi:outer membrane protein TolC
MRWKAVLLGFALLFAVTVGCKQQCFLTEADVNHYHHLMPAGLECDPDGSNRPTTYTTPTPSDVNHLDRPIRHLSLAEAIAISLENGTTGLQSLRNSGLANDDLTQFVGTGVTQPDSIRVFAIQPAIVGATLEAALARFDTEFVSSLVWNNTDELQQGLSSFSNGQTAQFLTGLAKPLPTGGSAGITFQTTYQNLTSPPRGVFNVVNPAYTTKLSIGFEQPLWQNFGEINQLLTRQPAVGGSSIGQLSGGPFTLSGLLNSRQSIANEGILITRVRFDQQRAEFQRNVHFLLMNVEVAYWTLYNSYMSLYSSEQAMRGFYEAWRTTKAKYEAGQFSPAELAQTRGQYEQSRGDRLTALGQVLEAERNLRALLGMPAEDGTRLVPCDSPTLAPYQPDWNAALHDTLTLRPELVLAREDLKTRQFNLIVAQNLLKPNLTFGATYTPVGLGSQLDGNGTFIDGTGTSRTSNAFRALASDHFNDWSMGLTLSMPLGFRAEHAATRVARLQLATAYAVLKDQEERAQRALTLQYRLVLQNYSLIQSRRAQREAFAELVSARAKEVAAGKTTPGFGKSGTIADSLVDAQQKWAAALASEYQAVTDYNSSLARFEFAKGTILQHDNVVISEGPMPQCAQVRAVEHERERTKALVLREHAQPVDHHSCVLPQLPVNGAPSMPALLHGAPPVPTTLDERPPQPTSLPPTPANIKSAG